MKNMRHAVTVLRPPAGNFGTRGEKLGKATTVYKEWRCAIAQVSGGEEEQGRQMVATATYAVTGYIDPANPIQETDWLVTNDGRTLEVASVQDTDLSGRITQLICGEIRD